MPLFIAFFLFISGIVFPYPAFAQFILGMENIPLIEELQLYEDPQNAISFDSLQKDGGSLVNAVTYSQIATPDEFVHLYTQTLTNMGWELIKNQKNAQLVFQRDHDQLQIDVIESSLPPLSLEANFTLTKKLP